MLPQMSRIVGFKGNMVLLYSSAANDMVPHRNQPCNHADGRSPNELICVATTTHAAVYLRHSNHRLMDKSSWLDLIRLQLISLTNGNGLYQAP